MAGAVLVVTSVPAGAQARITCAYTGPPANVMTVTISASSEAIIRRRGDEIRTGVHEPSTGRIKGAGTPCTGGVPTVLNTDTLDVRFRGGGYPLLDVQLAAGPLAPGATPEAVGAPEIELQISGQGLAAQITGTRGDDEFHWNTEGAGPGLNLNPLVANDVDADVVVSGGRDAAFLYASGDDGDDRILGEPSERGRGQASALGGGGADVLMAYPGSEGGLLSGGFGADVIIGGRFADDINGDEGNDRIEAGAGADTIRGGSGKDLILAGAGRDVIRSRDSARDTVRCGSGRDRVVGDRRDRLIGCESVKR